MQEAGNEKEKGQRAAAGAEAMKASEPEAGRVSQRHDDNDEEKDGERGGERAPRRDVSGNNTSIGKQVGKNASKTTERCN